MYSRIGDVTETIQLRLEFELVNFLIEASATLRIRAEGLSISFAAAFSLLGVQVTGSGTLSTHGLIEQASLMGRGIVSISDCDACPALEGVIHAEKPLDGLPRLYMSLDFQFLGVQVTGSAQFGLLGNVEWYSIVGLIPSSWCVSTSLRRTPPTVLSSLTSPAALHVL